VGNYAGGEFEPNAFGLYNMHGNVNEWCEAWYHNSYSRGPIDGREWASVGAQYRVIRGGAWDGFAHHLRSPFVHGSVPSAE